MGDEPQALEGLRQEVREKIWEYVRYVSLTGNPEGDYTIVYQVSDGKSVRKSRTSGAWMVWLPGVSFKLTFGDVSMPCYITALDRMVVGYVPEVPAGDVRGTCVTYTYAPVLGRLSEEALIELRDMLSDMCKYAVRQLPKLN